MPAIADDCRVLGDLSDRRSGLEQQGQLKMSPAGVLHDGTSCITMHVDEDAGILSKTMSPNRGNGCEPFVLAAFDSESAWATA